MSVYQVLPYRLADKNITCIYYIPVSIIYYYRNIVRKFQTQDAHKFTKASIDSGGGTVPNDLRKKWMEYRLAFGS